MNRPTSFSGTIFSLALVSLLLLGTFAPALAATVTDTFPLKATGKEWCRDNSKFFEPFKIKLLDGTTLTVIRDVLDTGDLTDIQATINTNGDNATIDAMTLNGRALPKNTSGLKEELALSGRDPNNPDHFITLRGTATFNNAGTLTKVTGTYVYQILSESGGVQDVDCFGSGTFEAKKPPSSGGGGGGGGTLTVTNAPASVKGNFVAHANATQINTQGAVTWVELITVTGGSGHAEVVSVSFDITTGNVLLVIFSMADGTVGTAWSCQGFLPPGCPGASVNRTAGTFTFVDTVLDISVGTRPPITLNGTLHFTPF
ncbi:MAG: hypothetical protein HP491_09100 [Nitrospira sp.]|nr:hypothetical protein [Nitrospira sp.]MBH0186499.1 hypothetical protein [Nitrospira sp.]